jgi:putrescine aminotransferase
VIDDVRGTGLMLAVEFVTSDVGYDVAKGMFGRGVLTAGTLVNAKCIRFEPAAIITLEQLDAVAERLDASLSDTKKTFSL